MVAGESAPRSAGIQSTAVLWTRDGVATALPPIPGFEVSEAFALNELGEAAGVSSNGVFQDLTATLWTAEGTPIPLPPLDGDTEAEAFGINNSGHVVGWSIAPPNTPGRLKPIVWDRDGNAQLLPLLPGDCHGGAFAINDRGEIVGRSGNTAVKWKP
jgi:uncharacterized membrane protein